MKISVPPNDEETGTVVFVLGAGCSADCGAPVMNDFMNKVREYRRRAPLPFREYYDTLIRFRSECLRISYVFDRWWENIEDLLTQAHLRELAGDENAKRIIDDTKRVLWDVYRREAESPEKHVGYDDFTHYNEWLAHMSHAAEDPRPVVVTMNYDVHLEGAMLRRKLKGNHREHGPLGIRPMYVVPLQFNDDEASFPVQGVIDEYNNDVRYQPMSFLEEMWQILEVVKLHGSVNWFTDAGEPHDELICAGARSPRPPHGFECQKEGFQRQITKGAKYDPLLIPPLLGKLSDHPFMKAQWFRALHAFKHARQIVIIGYSFPETDAFMTRLLAEGVRTSDKLEEILIINQEKNDDWWSRVERMFARSWQERNLLLLKGCSFAEFASNVKQLNSRTGLCNFREIWPS